MRPTSRAIEQVASRIERAYLRRCPQWRQAGLDPRIWDTAASVLIDAHHRDAWVPLDPELFVASQIDHLDQKSEGSDPWTDLTRTKARRRYVSRIREIISGLRRELRAEIRKAESSIRRGVPAEMVLLCTSRTMTPLGRYLTAVRIDRIDLADRLRAEAKDQHLTCPLYRLAAEPLVAEGFYPVRSVVPEISGAAIPPDAFCMN